MTLWLVASLAIGAEVDRGPSGTIVTIRPEDGEKAWVLSEENQPLPLPSDTPKPMWLVHPEAWRQAVALAEKYNAQMELPQELKQINMQLEVELANEKKLRGEQALDLEASRTESKMLRRSRVQWAVGAGVLGVVVGAAGVAVVVL